MAWHEVAPMEERVRFVLKATREVVGFGELGAQFGISRKTGYQGLARYETQGLAGMRAWSRRPPRSPTRRPADGAALILRERHRHARGGPKKLRTLLATKHGVPPVPAASTIGRILQQHGLTRTRRRRRPVSQPDRTTRTPATQPNAVGATDCTGWFRTPDGQRCDPLPSSDLYSRDVLTGRLVPSQRIEAVRPVFRQVFRRFGLPTVLRVDNGLPFGSHGVAGLSQLSVWWLPLGIRVACIEPAHPEQHGGHARRPRTLKAETARPPAARPRAQQGRFDRWRHTFNHERPHEALGMRCPAEDYVPSPPRYTDHPAAPAYPPHYHVRRVKRQGVIKWRKRYCFIGEALRGMRVGLVEVDEEAYDVYFGHLHLGRFDREGRLQPVPRLPAPASPRHADGRAARPGG